MAAQNRRLGTACEATREVEEHAAARLVLLESGTNEEDRRAAARKLERSRPAKAACFGSAFLLVVPPHRVPPHRFSQ
jgi:hypothetical protein